ncbi:hypothetical protein COBT_003971, partial [Conglomerata obtusa]
MHSQVKRQNKDTWPRTIPGFYSEQEIIKIRKISPPGEDPIKILLPPCEKFYGGKKGEEVKKNGTESKKPFYDNFISYKKYMEEKNLNKNNLNKNKLNNKNLNIEKFLNKNIEKKQEENAPVKNNNIKNEFKLINVNRLTEDKNGEFQLKSEKSLKLNEIKVDVISKLKFLQDGKKLVKNENLLLNNLSKRLAETKGQESANFMVQQLKCCASKSNLTKEKHAAYIIILNLIIMFEKNFFNKFLIVIKNLISDLNENEDKMLKNILEEIIFLTSNTKNEKNPQEKIERKNNTYDKK